MHREKRQDKSNATDHSRREHSGMRKLNIEAKNSYDQQNKKNIGLDDSCQELLSSGHFVRGDDGLRQSQLKLRAVEARDCAPVEFCEQVFPVGSYQVHELAVESFFFAESFGIGNGSGCKLRVTPPLRDVTAQVGGRFVHDFLVQRLVYLRRLPAKYKYWRGRASVGAWGHRRDVGRKQDEESGRSGARAGRRDIRAHRNFGHEDCLDDFPHRGVESARGIDRDENQRGVIRIRVVDAADDVFGEHRLDFAIDAEFEDAGGAYGR